ncbi:MAG: acyltransferase family protein [Pikeienuella sp.]
MNGSQRCLTIGDRAAGRENHFNLIRMMAAGGVLVSHAYPICFGAGAVEPLEAALGMTLGDLCVYVFFVVSGFFITKSFVFGSSWRRFLAARALRLFPGLAVVLAVTILVGGIFLTTATAGAFWASAPFYFLQNLVLFMPLYELPGVFENNPYGSDINGSLWTLAYEVLCYGAVFFAGMAGLFRAPTLVAAPAFAAALALLIVAPHLGLHVRVEKFSLLALPFFLGAAMLVWRDRIPLSLALAAGLWALALAAYWWAGPGFRPVFVLALSYSTMFLGFARAPALLAYNRLGDYSYGLYVYAFPAQQLATHFGVRDPLINVAVALPATLVCAVLSWRLVEEPALRFKSYRRGRSQAA